MLEVRGLAKGFGAGAPLLADVTLAFPERKEIGRQFRQPLKFVLRRPNFDA